MNFGYSERQLRIGACFKAHNLSFWDAADNFQFENLIAVPLTY